jgi:hypothetical protein
MGLGIAVVTFTGEIVDRVDDPRNFPHRLLPPADEDSDQLLAKVDWYGDTYFNYLQMKRFLREWDEMGKRARTTEEQTLIAVVRKFAVRCQGRPQPFAVYRRLRSNRRRFIDGPTLHRSRDISAATDRSS